MIETVLVRVRFISQSEPKHASESNRSIGISNPVRLTRCGTRYLGLSAVSVHFSLRPLLPRRLAEVGIQSISTTSLYTTSFMLISYVFTFELQ